MGLLRFGPLRRCLWLSRTVKRISCCKLLSNIRRARDSVVILPCKYIALEIRYSGPGFDMADAKRVNTDMFSFNPNELQGGGGVGGGTGSGLGSS